MKHESNLFIGKFNTSNPFKYKVPLSPKSIVLFVNLLVVQK